MSKNLRCVVVDDEPIAREIIESFIVKTPNLELLKSCKNAAEAIGFMQNSGSRCIFFRYQYARN